MSILRRLPGTPALLVGLLLALLAAGIATAHDACADGAAAPVVPFPWAPSYERAVVQARAEGKDIVLLFTGSDWCGHCITLEHEVFGAAEFARRAPQQFVFVMLDFPQDPALQARILGKATRDRLQKDFGVTGFPTLWLTTPDGMPYGTKGYAGGGPEAFFAELMAMRPHRDRLLPLLRAGRRADVALLRSTLPFLIEDDLLGLPHYAWVLERLRAVDPQGQLGLRQQADRIGELNQMMALFEGEAAWSQIHRFLLSARFIRNEHRYASALVLCAEHYLYAEGRTSEAIQMIHQAQRTPSLVGNAWAQGDFQRVLDRITATPTAGSGASR